MKTFSEFLAAVVRPAPRFGAYTEIRILRHVEGVLLPVYQFWMGVGELKKVDETKSYFFSPALRSYGGKRVLGGWCVWVDVDGALSCAGLLPPSVVVSSGRGFHVYWVFSEFLWADYMRSLMSRLVRVVGGADVKCRDATRFLRVPFTFNPKFSPPRRVEVVEVGRCDYGVWEIEEWLASAPAAAAAGLPSPSPHGGGGTVKLYRRGDVGHWFFWQSSQPYRVGFGDVREVVVSVDAECRVYALGGATELWRGKLGDVPEELRGYLTEIFLEKSC